MLELVLTCFTILLGSLAAAMALRSLCCGARQRTHPSRIRCRATTVLPESLEKQLLKGVELRMSEFRDPSHDFGHVLRVRSLALTIAIKESLPSESLQVVELAALFHDFFDWKHKAQRIDIEDADERKRSEKGDSAAPTPKQEGTEQEGAAEEGKEQKGTEQTEKGTKDDGELVKLLMSFGVESLVASEVQMVVRAIGFKDSLSESPMDLPKAARAVRDADRLDAMGCIGIARTFSYGGRKNLPLFDDTVPPRSFSSKEEYMKLGHSNVLNHFFEKLLLLKQGILTPTGKEIAEERHKVLVSFAKNFIRELSHTHRQHNRRFATLRKHPLLQKPTHPDPGHAEPEA
jgi:HD superfamily phosphodiesterase